LFFNLIFVFSQVSGTLGDTNDAAEYVRCDLYANDVNFAPPYLDIYGIKTADFILDNTISIYIPEIQIGVLKASQILGDGYIKFDILEETPGQLDPTIPIYTVTKKIFDLNTTEVPLVTSLPY
jgi:hypothetical protein